MAKWNFACGDGVTVRGLNNGDIDGFKGSPIRSLAREICQNSLDALPKALKALRDEGKRVPPVIIEFAEFEGTVPQKNELLQSLENMLAYWKMRQKQDMKVVEFLNLAIKCIKKGKIPYLRISDFNTTGLCGIAGVGTPWDNLITSVGASDKPSDAGGSKGIGHSATFACTDLQTVFYSTFNDEKESGFLGVARLVGRGKEDDPEYGWEDIGYYGEGKVGRKPLTENPDLGSGFVRGNKCGTDIFIAGFNKTDWETGIVMSAIDSFLLAFFRNKLVLRVGELEISEQKLMEVVQANEGKSGAFKHNANEYYKVLTSPATRKFERVVADAGRKGNLVLWLLIDPTLESRKVAMVRDTGMLIFEQGGINGSIRFAGILEVEGQELNAFLRGLENGQHTEWSEDRAPQGKIVETREFLKSIRAFCRESLLSMNEIKPGERHDSGLGFTADKGNGADSSADEEEDVNDELKPVIGSQRKREKPLPKGKRKAKKRVKVKPEDEPEEVNPPTPEPQPGPKPPAPTPTPPDVPPEPKPLPQVKWDDAETSELDYVCTNREESEYQLVFTPFEHFDNGRVKLFAVAEVDAYRARVVKAWLDDPAKMELKIVDGNAIEGFEFKKDEPLSFFVTLDYSDYCSLEVETYGHN